jgi:hypothetical protein
VKFRPSVNLRRIGICCCAKCCAADPRRAALHARQLVFLKQRSPFRRGQRAAESETT